MPLESLTGPSVFIDALVVTNPAGADDRREGDDHIRGVKNVLKNTFPNINAAVTLTDEQLNAAALTTGATFAAGSAAAPTVRGTGATTSGLYWPGTDQFGVATAGVARTTWSAAGNVSINPPASGITLSVAGGSSAGLNVTDSPANSRGRLTWGGSFDIWNVDNSSLRLGANNNPNMVVIGAGGNVTFQTPASGVHTINGTTVMPSQPLAEIRDSATRTTTGTFTTYGSTTLNLGGMSPNVTAGSITAPVAGTYRITMRGNFSVTGGSPIACGFELRIGGALVDSFVSIVTATNSVAVQRQTDAVRTLAASDVITIACVIAGGTSPVAQCLLFRAELIQ